MGNQVSQRVRVTPGQTSLGLTRACFHKLLEILIYHEMVLLKYKLKGLFITCPFFVICNLRWKRQAVPSPPPSSSPSSCSNPAGHPVNLGDPSGLCHHVLGGFGNRERDLAECPRTQLLRSSSFKASSVGAWMVPVSLGAQTFSHSGVSPSGPSPRPALSGNLENLRFNWTGLETGSEQAFKRCLRAWKETVSQNPFLGSWRTQSFQGGL